MSKTKFIITCLTALLFLATEAQSQINLSSNQFSYATPKTYEIGGIEVQGASNLDEGAIKLLSGLAVGDEIDVPGDACSEALRKLWKQDLFSDLQLLADRIEGGKIYLIIKIKERPRLSRFGFTGVSKSEADDIREKINLYKEKIVTENLVISTRQKVYDFYAEKGYRAAVVTITQVPDTIFRDHVRLFIDVDKKKKVKIKSINIIGNGYYTDYKIRRMFKETKERSVFKPFADLDTLGGTLWTQLWNDRKKMPRTVLHYGFDHIKVKIFKASKFLKENWEGDKELLVAKYNQKGFRDARVVHDSTYRVDEENINLDVVINEGHQYYFRNVKWIGNSKYTSAELSQTLGIKKGDIYDPVKLEQRLYMDQGGGDISSLYMDKGYLFFQLEPVEILVGEDSIDLEIRIYEGEQARINRVTVSGNTKTNDHVILRELYSTPGQLFSRADIIRSQQQLNVLGFFDPESMDVRPTPDPSSGTVDIEYVVTEKPNDQLTLQGGYGGGILVATVGIQFNNFSTKNIFKPKQWNGPLPSGDGQKLGLNFNTNGRQYQAFNLSFTEPWLGGKKPTSLTLSSFYSFFTLGANNRKYIETTEGDILNVDRSFFQRLGFTTQIGKRLKWPDNYFSFIFETSAQQYTLQNYNQFFFQTGQAYNLYGKAILTRKSTDDNIFPSMGSDMSFSVQFTPPYSSFSDADYKSMEAEQRFRLLEYHKWKFSWAYYTGLIGKQRKNKLVLYTKIGFGMLGLYNRNIGLVPFERFYLGGDPFSTTGIQLGGIDSREFISLRGYGGGGLSPTDGATLINKYTMELRYPFSLSQSFTAYGLAFAEAGNSWSDFNSYNPLEVYKSTGVGLRVFLPMFGLLGVDWAYRLDDTSGRPELNSSVNTERYRFHFTLGYQFGDL